MDLNLHNTDIRLDMLIKFSKHIGNSFAKIINTKVNSKPCQIAEMELFPQVWLQRQTQNFANTSKMFQSKTINKIKYLQLLLQKKKSNFHFPRKQSMIPFYSTYSGPKSSSCYDLKAPFPTFKKFQCFIRHPPPQLRSEKYTFLKDYEYPK